MSRYGTTRYHSEDGCGDDGLDFNTLRDAKLYCREQVKEVGWETCAIWDRRAKVWVWEYGVSHYID